MTAFPNGLGGGVETRRSYLAEDFPTGSQRSVSRWLKTLVGREDVIRVWLKPVGSKAEVWHHVGPLDELPVLDDIFVVEEQPDIEAIAA